MNDRELVAESLFLAQRDFTDYLNDYTNVFNLSPVQCTAVRKLCDLAQDLQKNYIIADSIGVTTDEAFSIADNYTSN